jgi:hypothetical protein
LKKQFGHKKRGKRDSLKFARYLFWVSWTWVLLFAVGELLAAVKTEDYGDKIIFCVVTVMALSSGGFALERALKQVGAAKSRRSRVNQRGATNGTSRKKPEAEIVQDPPIQEAEVLGDNVEAKPDEPPKRRKSKATPVKSPL